MGLAELFKKLHLNVSVRLEMESDSARLILQRGGPGGLRTQSLSRKLGLHVTGDTDD